MKRSGGSREGANFQGGGANLLFGPIFTENCMKMKEFGPGGGLRAYLAPPPLRNVLPLQVRRSLESWYPRLHAQS